MYTLIVAGFRRNKRPRQGQNRGRVEKIMKTHLKSSDAKFHKETAWAECPRADWLLWYAARKVGIEGGPTHQQVVLAACACARTSLRFVPAGEVRPLQAIETAEGWCRGEATIDDVREAARAADTAVWAARAARAARAAARAADAAARAADTAWAAAWAADAADAAAWAADAAAWAATHIEMCALVRKIIPSV